MSRAQVEEVAARVYPWWRHVHDPDSYWVTGGDAAVVLGVNRARVGQLGRQWPGLGQFVRHRDRTRLYRRAQLQTIAIARAARWSPPLPRGRLILPERVIFARDGRRERVTGHRLAPTIICPRGAFRETSRPDHFSPPAYSALVCSRQPAQATGRGAGPLSSPLRFTYIQYNSPGDDLPPTNFKLNQEYVTIYNPTTIAAKYSVERSIATSLRSGRRRKATVYRHGN